MKRNILFFFPDQWHADWMGGTPSGANGELPLKTPHLDKLRKEGVSFSQAFTPSPLCAPARACLASGKSYGECGVPNNHADFPLDQPTVYQRLRARGYRTASVGKLDLHKDLAKPLFWELDGSLHMEEWGFTDGVDNEGKMDGKNSFLREMKPQGPYLNYLYEKDPVLAEAYAREPGDDVSRENPYVTCLGEEDYCDNWLAHTGQEIIRDFPEGQPWFMQVNFTGPHGPFEVTQSMADRWENVDFPRPLDSEEDREVANKKRQYYAAMIENIDRLIGEFLEVLEERGERDNTIILFAADHGEMIGDHGQYGKCTWFRGSVSVPLIAVGPGIDRNRKTDALVMLQDLTSTILDYSGGDALEGGIGNSLRALLEGRTDRHRDYVESALWTPQGIDWRMTFDGRKKRVEKRKTGEVFLYDLVDDPGECRPRKC